MERLSIGKMAKLNQVTVQTLRYYEKFGSFVPHDCGSRNRISLLSDQSVCKIGYDPVYEMFGHVIGGDQELL